MNKYYFLFLITTFQTATFLIAQETPGAQQIDAVSPAQTQLQQAIPTSAESLSSAPTSVAVTGAASPNPSSPSPVTQSPTFTGLVERSPLPEKLEIKDGIYKITTNLDGKTIALSNGLSLAIPAPFRKKTILWNIGDSIELEKTKKEHWYRLYNQTCHDHVVAKDAKLSDSSSKP